MEDIDLFLELHLFSRETGIDMCIQGLAKVTLTHSQGLIESGRSLEPLSKSFFREDFGLSVKSPIPLKSFFCD